MQFKLSEDGTHYILSGVSGNMNALEKYEVPAVYAAEEGGQALPVTEIAEGAFNGCYSLYSVTLPEGLKKIGNYAFAFCAFPRITIPESVTEIGYSAFGMCKALKEIIVPQGVTQLGERAFYCCSAVEKAVIKAEITDLKYRTLYNSVAVAAGNVYTNTSLKEVYLPASLKKIHCQALFGNAITDLYFGGTKEQWDEMFFYDFEEDENGNNKEVEMKKEEVLSASITVHYEYAF